MEVITSKNKETMPVKDWALTIFISTLPIIGFIMLLIWAFSEETNVHKKNWAKGNLVIMLIYLTLFLLFLSVLGGFAFLGNFFN